MKKAEVLFLAIGGLEASRLEQTEFRTVKRRTPKVLLVAAIVALTLLLVGCAVVIYNKVHLKYIQHEIPTATVAQTEETPAPNIFTDCYPQQLPAGYVMCSGYPIDRVSRDITYCNEAGEYILFRISTGRDLVEISLDEPLTESKCQIFGWDGVMQTSETEQVLWWHNEADDYYARLQTENLSTDLKQIAQSVGFGKSLPMAFICKEGTPWDVWYPQQIPEGYSLNDVTIGPSVVHLDYSGDNGSISYVVSFVDDLSDISDPPHDSFVWTEETVAGQKGRMLTTSGDLRILVWKNEQEGFNAYLSTMDESVDILAMAESVAPGAPLEISKDYLGPDFSIELEQPQDVYFGWAPIYPQNVPEGYFIDFVSEPSYGEQIIRYENAAGDMLDYTFYYRLGKYGRDFSGTGQPQQVDINGNIGYLGAHSLIWTDDAKGYAFTLTSDGDVDLLPIAKSVAPGPELEPTYHSKTLLALEELGDYQITELPDGVEQDELTGCPLSDGGSWYSYIRRWYFNKKTNAQIFFTYETYNCGDKPISLEEAAKMYIGGDSDPQYQTICGYPGAFIQKDASAEVVWFQGNEQKGVLFDLYSEDYPVEELLTMAESVRKQ